MKEIFRKKEGGVILATAILFFLPLVNAAADFDVNSFSCTPSEVVVGNVFSCTVQIKNNGDASGSVSVATLYSDTNDWLEDSNYPQASGTSVSPGQTTEIIFSGLRATKSGNNGFSKIMLDSVADTYVADQNIKVNAINVVVSVSNSASSAVMGESFDVTAEVTAGGNIDVSLSFVVSSGGCTIGSQTNPKTISDMQDGNRQSRVWSVTQGSSGSCRYSVSASATGSGGIASTTDTTSSSVSCTDCPVSSSSSSSSGGGGASGGGGGAGVTVKSLGELTKDMVQTIELSAGENVNFSLGGVGHYFSVTEVNDTIATIIIESEKQTFILDVGEEINVDLTGDGMAEISITLKSINLITKKAKFSLIVLAVPISATKSSDDSSKESVESPSDFRKGEFFSRNVFTWRFFFIFIIVLLIIGTVYYFLIKSRKNLWGRF